MHERGRSGRAQQLAEKLPISGREVRLERDRGRHRHRPVAVSEMPRLADELEAKTPVSRDRGDDEVDLSQGYDITVSVQEPPPALLYTTSNSGSANVGNIQVFAGDSNGNLAPIQNITGALTTLRTPLGIAVVGDKIIVADQGTSTVGSVDIFPIAANGNVAPLRRVTMTNVDQVAASGGDAYVTSGNKVYRFQDVANSDAAPVVLINTATTAGALTVSGGEVFVAMRSPGTIGVYSATDGSVKRTITDPDRLSCAVGVAVRGQELYVANSCRAQILVYPRTWTGSSTPLRVMNLFNSGAGSMVVSQGELFMADHGRNALRVFLADATGDVDPTRSIIGAATTLRAPSGIALR